MPPKRKKAEIKEEVLYYIIDHEGEISIPKCAEYLGLSEAEVKKAIELLQREGKLEREKASPPPKLAPAAPPEEKPTPVTPLVAVVVVVAVVSAAILVPIIIYYTTSTEGYPAVTATAQADNENIKIMVSSGSIPTGDWQYSVTQASGSYSWVDGTEKLDAPYVTIANNQADGTCYVSLRHKPSGHIYFADVHVEVIYG